MGTKAEGGSCFSPPCPKRFWFWYWFLLQMLKSWQSDMENNVSLSAEVNHQVVL